MHQSYNKLFEIKLVGIKCRTNNLAEQNPVSAKIGTTLQNYFKNAISSQVLNRKMPQTTYCVYTEYDTDHSGDYTYFVGEEVTEFSDVGELAQLTIPSQNYVKFTNGPGIMPAVCIEVWTKIWSMSANELKGQRSYVADFEVYDHRAINPAKTELDVYIGII